MSVNLTHQIHQYLTQAPSSLFAQQEVTLLDNWQGDENLLWRVRAGGEDAVVKLFMDAGQARSRRQFDGQRVFAPIGLAPVPLWADRYPHGLSRQLIVYRWCAGEKLDGREPGMVEAWAEAIARLHATPPDEVQRFSPHPINLDFYWRIEQGSMSQVQAWLADGGLVLSHWFASLTATTANLVMSTMPLWQAAAPSPVHGDLSVAHTLVERGQIVLLDWELFGLGDPAQDVARLLQREEHVLGHTLVDVWLARYLAQSADATLEGRIATFRKLLDVHNVVYLLNGLQQHSGGPLDPALRDALPFVESSLANAIEKAAAKLDLPLPFDASDAASALTTWLTSEATQNS